MRKDAVQKLKSQDKKGKEKKSTALKKKAEEKRAIVTTDDRQSIEQAKELGLLDNTESVNDIIKSLENIEPIYKIDQAEDRIDNKILAIMVMDGLIREWQGELIPNFSLAGRLVGRSKSYMHGLWEDKDIILAQRDTILDTGLQMVRVKMIINLLKMTNALDEITVADYKDMILDPKSFKNFISFYQDQRGGSRLLANLSTKNVDHHHKHEGRVKLVPTDEM